MLEHPAITETEHTGGKESPIVGTCYYCSSAICKGETHYILDDIVCCNEWDCKAKAFTENAQEMAVKMADDLDITNDAVNWYFDEFTVEKGERE